MKIDGIEGSGGARGPVKPDLAATGRPRAAEESGSDRVTITPAASRMHELAAAASRLPEIRAERVARLAQAIASGSYGVDPRELASRIVEAEDALPR